MANDAGIMRQTGPEVKLLLHNHVAGEPAHCRSQHRASPTNKKKPPPPSGSGGPNQHTFSGASAASPTRLFVCYSSVTSASGRFSVFQLIEMSSP